MSAEKIVHAGQPNLVHASLRSCAGRWGPLTGVCDGYSAVDYLM